MIVAFTIVLTVVIIAVGYIAFFLKENFPLYDVEYYYEKGPAHSFSLRTHNYEIEDVPQEGDEIMVNFSGIGPERYKVKKSKFNLNTPYVFVKVEKI